METLVLFLGGILFISYAAQHWAATEELPQYVFGRVPKWARYILAALVLAVGLAMTGTSLYIAARSALGML